jgi:hypothetical protein
MLDYNVARSAVLSVALLASAAAASAEGRAPERIEVKGAGVHVAERARVGWSLHGPGADGQAVVPGAPGEWLLEGAGGRVLLRARTGPGGEVQVVGDGDERLTVRPDGEGYRLFDAGGALRLRVKVKPDKFNVYDSGGARLRHGKAKADGFSVKGASGAREEKIRGPRSLREASFFALGLDFGEAALLWRALDR